MNRKLAFPNYQFKLKDEGNKTLVFDELRNKWVILTDEENVRQHLWKYLHKEHNYLDLVTVLTDYPVIR